MKKYLTFFLSLIVLSTSAQKFQITSPDRSIKMEVNYENELFYSITYHDKLLIDNSPLGFEFKNEEPMKSGMSLLNVPNVSLEKDSWVPVVKNKHSSISLIWNEAKLSFKETKGDRRQMDFFIRVYDNGVAFRYQLYGGRKIGNRQITRELTGFSLPETSSGWVAEYPRPYTSSQETEFVKTALTDLATTTVAGLPFLVEVDKENYVAITEANIDDFSGFYIGKSAEDNVGQIMLTTKLSPLPGENENGVKTRFVEKTQTPWRVLMIGNHPGKFIESEIIHGLNPPCAIEDPSWIKPGMSAWDHWWSGEVKMEMDVIKEYIDLAAAQGWPYMLIDWQWYGPFNRPEADITKPAPQLNMPEILEYARSKNVRCWLWLYNTDVNKNDSYKEAFALYEKWGIAGIKIDFMDRDDQEMVNWYRRIIKKAAEHKLLVNFHGAYKPDGIDRTYPNMITREGVLGEEYSKFSNRIIPEHNITLAFTRMLAGQMDYTPGGFLNVTREGFKQQSPTLIANTRCAELSKFIIYESPLTVFSEHPKYVLGQPGADFLKIVPTVWDDTRFIDGYPGEYIVMAKRSGKQWFVGAMNNRVQRTIEIETSFLPEGRYILEYWEDGKDANKKPTNLNKKKIRFGSDKPLKIKMANSGGYVAVFTPEK
ncbi:glycoside hydrolase family 97 protein [Sphingobacterium corticibacterium]|uniref:Glycoside hydrolase family 97 protein n=1 Tax=Sphingobacterium corticibacterium TaxID=2484746 RepID=A0A4Q6XP04_9SPHI|nr:glycoside hydrolase family 97 protein [Sphingobacterium corticibacterium]RZF57464.1 glycoside hydrolase family 97 protein [Sphingobacterium corticibacterium]